MSIPKWNAWLASSMRGSLKNARTGCWRSNGLSGQGYGADTDGLLPVGLDGSQDAPQQGVNGRSHTMPARASAETSIRGAPMFWIFIAIVWVLVVGVGVFLVLHSYPDPDRIDVKRHAYRAQGLVAIGVAS